MCHGTFSQSLAGSWSTFRFGTALRSSSSGSSKEAGNTMTGGGLVLLSVGPNQDSNMGNNEDWTTNDPVWQNLDMSACIDHNSGLISI